MSVCPVELEFLGMPIGTCREPITHEVTFACDGGCPREPLGVCAKHADVLSEDKGDAFCAECERTGTPQQIHPESVRKLGGAS
jgi:hypothetical protein